MFKSVLLTNLDRSILLHIGHVCPGVFMERDKVDIYKNAKRTVFLFVSSITTQQFNKYTTDQ